MNTITIFLALILLQTVGRPKLNDLDREHLLKSDDFQIYADVVYLPNAVKNSFSTLTNEKSFAMANPGQEFQVTDVILKQALPARRLILAGTSTDHCFVHYEKGGRGHAYYLVLFQLKNRRANFVWGASSWQGFPKLDSLRNAIRAARFTECDVY